MCLSVSQLTSSTHRPMTMVFASSRCFNEPGLSPTLTTANREDPKPGPAMGTSAYYSQHNALIASDLPGNHRQLLAGHKKDIVLTNKLCTQRRRVVIYGWHKASGRPIQPLSLVHGESYADYSHGVAHTVASAGAGGSFSACAGF